MMKVSFPFPDRSRSGLLRQKAHVWLASGLVDVVSWDSWMEVLVFVDMEADHVCQQRQTVVSQFYQLDRLVVEGGKTVCGSPSLAFALMLVHPL